MEVNVKGMKEWCYETYNDNEGRMKKVEDESSM